MIGSIMWTLGIVVLCSAPGVLLARGRRPGERAALAVFSLTIAMLATALLGAAIHALRLGSLPSAAVMPIALLMTLAAWRRRRPGWNDPGEWQEWAFGAAFAAIGLISFAVATGVTPSGDIVVRTWYNADGFKHLGHVHALANWGVPARDIFGNGNPLYYYWLSYVAPGAATALGGNAVAATLTYNALLAALFASVLYGALRAAGARSSIALFTASLAIFATSPSAYVFKMLQGFSLDEMLALPYAPKWPAFLALSQFIPQHVLAMALALGAALVVARGDAMAAKRPRATKWMAVIALGAMLTISTLLGAMLLFAYGLCRLYRDRFKAVPELAAIGLAGTVFVVALHVVQFGNPGSALESPLFSNPSFDMSPWQRGFAAAFLLVGSTGLPPLVAVFLLTRWQPRNAAETTMRDFAVTLLLAAFATTVASAILMPARVSMETNIRAVLPFGAAAAIAGAWGLEAAWRSGRRQARRVATAILAVVVLVAAPGSYICLGWLIQVDDSKYTTRVPAADVLALKALRENSDPSARVWQFPEPPVLAFEPGDDAWTPVFAGRSVPNSQRATDYAAAAPYVARSQGWFAGKDVPIPGDMDWVYLSRALHPKSYDMLVERLARDPAWRMRSCYSDACLFERAARASR